MITKSTHSDTEKGERSPSEAHSDSIYTNNSAEPRRGKNGPAWDNCMNMCFNNKNNPQYA